MRKLTSIPLILIFVLSLAAFAVSAAVFSDVPSSAPYYSAVTYLNKAGILSGRGDGTFDPNGSTTRAEFCAFLARAEGFRGSGGAASRFRDVADDYWAGNVISYCADRGYIAGYEDGSFQPARPIRYEEAVKMVASAAGIAGSSASKTGPFWYSGYYFAADEHGFLKNTSFQSGASATRSFVAQVLYNAIENGYFSGKNGGTPSATQKPTAPPPTHSSKNPDGPVIVLDPGHNHDVADTGARGNDLKEEDITWQIANRVRPLLENAGFHVIMTRNSIEDTLGTSVTESLAKRVEIANEASADVFVSIHCNSGGGTGTETYCYQKGGDAEDLANAIQKNIIKETGMRDRGVKTGNLYVVRNTVMPAVLVETGFLDKQEDAQFMASDAGQQKYAAAIAKGICEYMGIKYVG